MSSVGAPDRVSQYRTYTAYASLMHEKQRSFPVCNDSISLIRWRITRIAIFRMFRDMLSISRHRGEGEVSL